MVAGMSAASTHHLFEFTVDVLQAGQLTYRLLDFSGTPLETAQLDATEGLHNLVFDLSVHPEGVYRVNLEMGAETENLYIRRVLEAFSAKPNVASKDSGRKKGRN